MEGPNATMLRCWTGPENLVAFCSRAIPTCWPKRRGVLRTGERFATVVYAHQLEVSIGRCVRDLEVIAKAGLPEEAVGQVIYLPL